MGRPLKIAKAQAVLTITATTAATDYVTVSQNLNTLVILRGMQFVTASTVGGLTGGTTYWVLNVIDANNFTASATAPDANRTSTAVPLSDTTSQTVAATVGLVDSGFSNPDGSNTATNSTSYGVVGGNTALYGKQVLVDVAFGVAGAGTITVDSTSPNIDGAGTDFANTMTDGTVVTLVDGTVLGVIADIANANATFATFAANASTSGTAVGYVYATAEAGYILRQKGKTKYLVQGTVTGLIGQAFTANVANTALTPNTMSIISTNAASGTSYISSLNDYQSEVFPATIADGSLTPGSVYTIYSSGNTAWTSYGAASNITGITFTATSAGGSGTGLAVLNSVNPDVIATFGTAYAANTYGGQPNPIVTINNA